MVSTSFPPQNKGVRHLVTKYMLIGISEKASTVIASAFFIVYLLEHMTFGELGIVLSVLSLTVLFMDYPSGRLADKIGSKNVIFLAYGTYLVGWVSYIFVQRFFVLFVLISVIWGFATAQASGTSRAWFVNTYKQENQGSLKNFEGNYSRVLAAIQLSTSIIVFVGGLIAVLTCPQVVFLVGTGFCGLTILLSFCFMKEKKKQRDMRSIRDEDSTRDRTASSLGLKSNIKKFVPFKSLIASNNKSLSNKFAIGSLAFIYAFTIIIFRTQRMTFQPVTLNFGFNYFFLSIFESSVVLFQSLSYYLRSKLTLKLSNETQLCIHYTIFAIICFMFAFLADTTNVLATACWIVGNFVLYFVACFFVVSFDQLYNEVIKDDTQRVSLLSLRSTVQGLVVGIASIFLGYGIENWGMQIYLIITLVPLLCALGIKINQRFSRLYTKSPGG
ncbi:MAG: MFS transporter [Candidatus Hodarchaeota archaeon]